MVRSMFSGVAGMKAHQTRMDVIGNNISNVNTYGFKSSRVTFRDAYYQSMRGASAGTGTKGGNNPSSVGYGSAVGSIDVLQTQSTMANTGNPLDLGIAGDGFLQVQDAAGNTFYTRAGMLDIDSYGNLVDLNGNFVLGVSGSPVGQAPSSNHIKFTIPSVDPKGASATDKRNDITYKISASKESEEGNVVFNFLSTNDMPIGEKVQAVVTSSGINIRLNAKETFSNIGELNTLVNAAITKANGGKEHPGGSFTIEMDPATKFNNLTGAEIAGSEFGVKSGSVPIHPDLKGQFSITGVGDEFKGADVAELKFAMTKAKTETTDAEYEITMMVGTVAYKATLTSSQMKSAGGSVILKNAGGSDKDTITLGYPSESSLLGGVATKKPIWTEDDLDPATGKVLDKDDPRLKTTTVRPYLEKDKTDKLIPEGYQVGDYGPLATAGGLVQFDTTTDRFKTTAKATPSNPSKELGLGSRPFTLQKGTEGGAQTVADLTGISIGSDGIIRASHASFDEPLEIGRIDLATFENPKGLEQSGSTYFVPTANSGPVSLAKPGTAGAGKLAGSALEMSNVDLSQEFSDMITTQRGFQANSRIITVSDTMLEELINLKR